MSFISGFALKDENKLFEAYFQQSRFCVAGFDFGAQKAFEKVLHVKTRVDKLLLFSPAFFQDKDEAYKKLHLNSFKKNQKKYVQDFLKNCAYPSSFDMKEYLNEPLYEDFKECLEYEFKEEDLKKITQKGVLIEVYLGEKDSIIDSSCVKDFFQKYATVYFIKNVGHILK